MHLCIGNTIAPQKNSGLTWFTSRSCKLRWDTKGLALRQVPKLLGLFGTLSREPRLETKQVMSQLHLLTNMKLICLGLR
jgi:hypothetical protein